MNDTQETLLQKLVAYAERQAILLKGIYDEIRSVADSLDEMNGYTFKREPSPLDTLEVVDHNETV